MVRQNLRSKAQQTNRPLSWFCNTVLKGQEWTSTLRAEHYHYFNFTDAWYRNCPNKPRVKAAVILDLCRFHFLSAKTFPTLRVQFSPEPNTTRSAHFVSAWTSSGCGVNMCLFISLYGKMHQPLNQKHDCAYHGWRSALLPLEDTVDFDKRWPF